MKPSGSVQIQPAATVSLLHSVGERGDSSPCSSYQNTRTTGRAAGRAVAAHCVEFVLVLLVLVLVLVDTVVAHMFAARAVLASLALHLNLRAGLRTASASAMASPTVVVTGAGMSDVNGEYTARDYATIPAGSVAH